MHFHPACRREILHIAGGCAALTLLLVMAAGLMRDIDCSILFGALGGCVVSIGNFSVMCLTIQKAVGIEDAKMQRSFIRGSYNARLLLQALWVVMAFALPQINAVAAATPLLFPGLLIFLNRKMHKMTQ